MATITLSNPQGSNKAPVQTSNLKTPYVIWREIDLAAAVTAKGSALAVADVIEGLRIPKDHVVLHVFAKKTSAMTGTSADLTFDIGITGVDTDYYVDGWDYDAATVGSYSTPLGVQLPLISAVSDTIDILIATQTGTVTGGKVALYAVVVDLTVQGRGAIAQPKS